MFNVLVVDNDKQCNLNYRSYLEKHGYSVLSSFDAEKAMSLFKANQVDIILSEIQLPGIDGTMLAGAIRKIDPEVPIMMITSLDDIASKKRAFAVDIDDYMVKPIDLNELLLRIPALLRRAHSVSKRQITIGDAVIDADTMSVTIGSRETSLPPKEFLILLKLCSTPGQIFTRREIMNDIWGMGSDSDERTVDVHIRRLREQFGDEPSFAIETIRGAGYKVVERKSYAAR